MPLTAALSLSLSHPPPPAPPPPPPSSKHIAKCVDGGGKPVEFRSKGFGGVYDPLTCSPIGGLNPKPVVGYDACTPGMIIRLYYQYFSTNYLLIWLYYQYFSTNYLLLILYY